MGWHYRDPMTFPARYSTAIHLAAAYPDEWQLLGSARSLSEAAADMERFRWYRWCLKSKSDHFPGPASIILGHKFRTISEAYDDQILLYTRASLKTIDELYRLNPDIRDLIHSIGQ